MANPRMSRAHFQLIADTVKDTTMDEGARLRLAAMFAARLSCTNPQFNKGRFLDACGVER